VPVNHPRTARGRSRGFTLIELMIGITLLSVLLALAAPSLATWVHNTQVRTVAQSLQTGLRLAQTEAVRRSRLVVFSLTNDIPSKDSSASTDGKNWAIHFVPPTDGDAVEDEDRFIQGGAFGDSSAGVTVTGSSAVCFNSAGRQVANTSTGVDGAECSFDIDSLNNIYKVQRDGADRPLWVIVSLGGQVRMCDPARSIADSPDGCPDE